MAPRQLSNFCVDKLKLQKFESFSDFVKSKKFKIKNKKRADEKSTLLYDLHFQRQVKKPNKSKKNDVDQKRNSAFRSQLFSGIWSKSG